jgi:hypothetical protein
MATARPGAPPGGSRLRWARRTADSAHAHRAGLSRRR